MPIDDLTALGQKMRGARKNKELTQQELSDLSHVFSAEPYYTPSVSTSYTSQTSSGLSFSLADKNASISKVFRLSASAVYLKLGCLVMSYLSERNGRTPRNCKMHLPPSITASSSWLISSLPQCQVENSITDIEMFRLPKYSYHVITVDFIFALLYPFKCSDLMV